MPFFASNKTRTKPIRSGIEFPITHGKKVVAVLVAEDDKPDEVHVTLVGHGVTVSSGKKSEDVTKGSTVIKAKNFTISSPKTGETIAVKYEPPEEGISLE